MFTNFLLQCNKEPLSGISPFYSQNLANIPVTTTADFPFYGISYYDRLTGSCHFIHFTASTFDEYNRLGYLSKKRSARSA